MANLKIHVTKKTLLARVSSVTLEMKVITVNVIKKAAKKVKITMVTMAKFAMVVSKVTVVTKQIC
jgi:hypothetical protein